MLRVSYPSFFCTCFYLFSLPYLSFCLILKRKTWNIFKVLLGDAHCLIFLFCPCFLHSYSFIIQFSSFLTQRNSVICFQGALAPNFSVNSEFYFSLTSKNTKCMPSQMRYCTSSWYKPEKKMGYFRKHIYN